MTNIWILLKMQLLGFFGFNKAIKTKDPKEKKKFIYFMISYVFLMIGCCFLSFTYSNAMATSYKMIGDVGIILSIMLAAASIMVLITTVYKVSGILFGFKDYDMIISLPVTVRQIVASRVLMLYVMNILFALVIIVPSGIVYAMNTSPSMVYYIVFAVTLFLIPLVPIIIATTIGAIITIIASKFKHMNIISILLSVVFLAGYLYLSMRAGEITQAEMANMAKSINEMIYGIYPLSKLYIEALVDYNMISWLLFVVISLGSFIIFNLFLSINYRSINTLLTTTKTKANYKMKGLIGSSQLGALYKRELKRYFSSSLYVMNTSFGLIMLLIFSVALFVIGAGSIEQLLEMPGFAELINKAAPLVVSMFIVMSCTTGSSISLEGKQLWIAKSIPVNEITIFLSKILVNLTLTIPVILITSTIIAVKLQPSILEIIMLYLTPIAYAVFSAMIGIIINLLFPVIDWKTEVTVIKQSAASIVSMLAGMVSVAIPVIIALSIKSESMTLVVVGTTVALLGLSFIMYQYLKIKGALKFKAL